MRAARRSDDPLAGDLHHPSRRLPIVSATVFSVLACLGLNTARGARAATESDTVNGVRKRCAVITGANSGIGRSVAIELCARDWEVIPACRSQKKAWQAEEDILRAV